MSDDAQRAKAVRQEVGERYSHGYGAITEHLAQRSASTNTAFILPYLRPGMSVLDCGCGPGTNTAALAEAVAPGQVVGIDIEESQIIPARDRAERLELPNLQFEVANVYELSFPGTSFDAVYAHTVLQHLSSPLKALREIFRVLKPGGLVGVREEDQGSRIMAPHDPTLERANQLYMRFWQHNGGDPFVARRHRRLLREAGFERISATASTECWGDAEATRRWGETSARVCLEPTFADEVIALGWADRRSVEEMAAAFRAWGNHPDAFLAWVCCEAVGWKM